MEEEFREIPGYPAYKISNMGNIISRWQKVTFAYVGFVTEDVWKPLPQHRDRKGYPMVHLADGVNKPKMFRVHRLVALVFHGNPPEGKNCVRHLDGNPLNNCADNLAWGSYKENEDDKRNHGTWHLRMGGAKLTEADSIAIREKYESGVSQKELAKEYNVTRETITRVVNKTIWRDK